MDEVYYDDSDRLWMRFIPVIATDRQTDRHTDTQTDTQTQTHTQTHTHRQQKDPSVYN